MEEAKTSLTPDNTTNKYSFFFQKIQDSSLSCISRHRKISLAASLGLAATGVTLILLSQRPSSSATAYGLIAGGSLSLLTAFIISCCVCRSSASETEEIVISRRRKPRGILNNFLNSRGDRYSATEEEFRPFRDVPGIFHIESVNGSRSQV